jgi:hypothetical protein
MTFRIAFKALGRNKMRTGLTMLGMIIGVSAVITLVAMGNGAQAVIEQQIKGAGTNMITVNAGNFTMGGRGGAGTATSLTVADARQSAGMSPACNTSPRGSSPNPGRGCEPDPDTRVQGTDVDLALIRAWPTRVGMFSPAGRDRRREGGRIGSTVNEMLFGTRIRLVRSSGTAISRSR